MADIDSRTRALLEGPITATLLRMAVPNIVVMFAQAGGGLVETCFIGTLGTDALAGVALVFPVLSDAGHGRRRAAPCHFELAENMRSPDFAQRTHP